MESFNKVLNERLENLNKLATETHNKKANLLSEKVDKDITALLDRLQKLENEHRESVKKLHKKHANHTTEINHKTDNISTMITQLSDRVKALEAENDQLKKKLDVITYTEDKMQEDIQKLASRKPLEKTVVVEKDYEMPKNKRSKKKSKKEEEEIEEVSEDLGLNENDLRKVRLKGTLDEEESTDDEYIRKDVKKSFVEGIYQTWTGKAAKGSNLPEFTITLYGYKFKSIDTAGKQFKHLLQEAKAQESHTQEKLSNTNDGWLFEKPVNTVLVRGKEFEIAKAEAVFYKGKVVYDINISFINNKMSPSDLKTLVAFLGRK